ncbi:uroporphyrinogen-III synthase [Bacillus sp. FJAT-42376]|uniref:uroporphyrinogen-III synthase n=1 Tax=Bacillus sp. FJAT-42376 TaxID=2014076 RepID=UPI000F507D90|nr:uroporphyrinogen-III synthase [Bacillus sp. FJAT-42376]AZB44138.1 uroporphyrinogen-III synthase [Bacillus sp. FJAT-42376]
MKKLLDRKIVFAGQRKADEIKKMIENMGGTFLHRPAQGTVFLNDEKLKADVLDMINHHYDWIILTTGMGSEAIVKKAEEMGKEKQFLDELERMSIGIRGYKTAQFLKSRNLSAAAKDDDGSNAGLLRELAKHEFKGKRVVLQLHGERAPMLVEFFQQQGAECKEIQPYLHVAPDEQTMHTLLDEIISQKIDAVYFTSKPQAKFLMEFARNCGTDQQVLSAFSESVAALAVGKVTAQSLREEGISRIVVPDHERMGSAIVELAKYFETK